MSGPQFIHLQTFSRKPNPAGQCVAQVLGELVRAPEFSHHVNAPEPPELVDGVPASELIARHDAMIETAKVEVNVKGKTHYRAVRKDRHTLMTAVASYPIPRDQIEGNPEEEAAYRRWEARNVAFFKKLFGDQYQATFRHTDEPYPHLHAYALPENTPGIDATQLHPGKRAKTKAESKERKNGASDREAVASGNRALKVAMRKFQDVYFKHVGEPCGLLRIGPRRQRLSRKDYQAQKHAARLRSVSALELRSADLTRRADGITAAEEQLQTQRECLDQVKERNEARSRALSARERQNAQAVHGVKICIERLRHILGSIGKSLGFEVFKSVRDGLDQLEGYTEALQTETSLNVSDHEADDQNLSW